MGTPDRRGKGRTLSQVYPYLIEEVIGSFV